jgi:hypothetical protein
MQNLPHRKPSRKTISKIYFRPPWTGSELRAAFSGQARLLAARADRGLPLDLTSLRRLLDLGELITLERLAA